ncbi:hypothetical protein GCM10010983_25910 [Caulobacter rhizosphaerae]|nr:hypothetical protein GCM10010983_25910 [Caulobacter rhizosphaerae]
MTFPDPGARHKPWSRFTAPKFVDGAYGFMEFLSKMASTSVNASRPSFAPSGGASKSPALNNPDARSLHLAMALGGQGGIVLQGRQGCGARERGDEWRNVH